VMEDDELVEAVGACIGGLNGSLTGAGLAFGVPGLGSILAGGEFSLILLSKNSTAFLMLDVVGLLAGSASAASRNKAKKSRKKTN
jgi:hypothetical protein